jgi:hypothetical protein
MKQFVVLGALFALPACAEESVTPSVAVTVTLGGFDEMFVAYTRSDEADWVKVNDYEFVDGVVAFDAPFDRYLTVAVRCTGTISPTSSPTYVLERSIARGDFSVLDFPCHPGRTATHRIYGQVAGVASIYMGGVSAPGFDEFELEVPSGTYDFVATNTTSLYYQPSIVVAGDMELPAIDIDADGTARSTSTVAVPSELAEWITSSHTTLTTPNGTHVPLAGLGSNVVVPSRAVLDQGVQLEAYIDLFRTVPTRPGAQSIRAPVSGLVDTAAVASFPAPLSPEILPTSHDALEVSFSDLPPAADYVLTLTEDGPGDSIPSVGHVVATDGWRTASSAPALRFDPPAEMAVPLTRTDVSVRARFARLPDNIGGSVPIRGAENSHSGVSTVLAR